MRIFVLRITVLFFATLTWENASSQELVEVPIDLNSPAVKTFEDRVAQDDEAPPGLAAAPSVNDQRSVPSELFVVGFAQPAGELRSDPIMAAAPLSDSAVREGLNNIIFDESNLTWMSISYPPPIDAEIYCSWRVSPAQIAAQEAAIAERLADEQHAEDLGNAVSTISDVVPPDSRLERERVELADADDPELYPREIERSFLIAGRSCVMIRNCESEDSECTVAALDSLIDDVSIIQLGIVE